MTPIRRIAIALVAAAFVASLGGCATAPVPGSVAEQLWFDKATGYDINQVPPEARFMGLRGYPHTDRAGVRFVAPSPDEQ